MCIAGLYNPQLGLFRAYTVSEQFASTWRASVAQTSTGSPLAAGKELRHAQPQPLAKVTARAGFQLERSNPGKILGRFKLWRSKVQGYKVQALACTLLLSRETVP